jgi:hypothetical protein
MWARDGLVGWTTATQKSDAGPSSRDDTSSDYRLVHSSGSSESISDSYFVLRGDPDPFLNAFLPNGSVSASSASKLSVEMKGIGPLEAD